MRTKTLPNYKKNIIKEEISQIIILAEAKKRLNHHDYKIISKSVHKYGINSFLNEQEEEQQAKPDEDAAAKTRASYEQTRDRVKKWAAAKRNKITGELTKDMTDEGAIFFMAGPGKEMKDLQNDIDRADFILRNTKIFSEADLDAAGTYLYFKLGESTFFKLYDGDLSKGEIIKPKSQKQPDGGTPPPAPQGAGAAGAAGGGVPPQIKNMEDDFENPKAPGIFTSILDSYKYAFGANANMWKGIYNWFGKAEKAPPARQDDLLLQLLMKLIDKMEAKGGEAAKKADEIEKEVEVIKDEPDEPAPEEGDQEQKAVPLFKATGEKGGGDLYNKIFTSTRQRIKDQGLEVPSDKIEMMVKSIMKDLSAQLRANDIQVMQEAAKKGPRGKKGYYKGFLKKNPLEEDGLIAHANKKSSIKRKNFTYEKWAKIAFKNHKEIYKTLDNTLTALVNFDQMIGNSIELDEFNTWMKVLGGMSAGGEKTWRTIILKKLKFEKGGFKTLIRGRTLKGVQAVSKTRTKPEKGTIKARSAIYKKLETLGLDKKQVDKLVNKIVMPHLKRHVKNKDIKITESRFLNHLNLILEEYDVVL